MNQAIINAITHSVTEQLNAALEDIVTSAMETYLKCDDFDTQYDATQEALCNFEADIHELAANVTETIRFSMSQRIEDLQCELGERFENEVLPHVKTAYEQDGVMDRPARREAWCNFIDSLNKDGELTEYEASRIDFDVESL